MIDKLTNRIKTLTERVAEYDNFMKIKGLVGGFKEFIRLNYIAEKLQKNKLVVEMREPDKVKKRSLEKRQDVAI